MTIDETTVARDDAATRGRLRRAFTVSRFVGTVLCAVLVARDGGAASSPSSDPNSRTPCAPSCRRPGTSGMGTDAFGRDMLARVLWGPGDDAGEPSRL